MYKSLDGTYYNNKEMADMMDQTYRKNFMDKQNRLLAEQNKLLEEQNKTSNSNNDSSYTSFSYFDSRYIDNMSYEKLVNEGITTKLFEYYLENQKSEINWNVRTSKQFLVLFIITVIVIIGIFCISTLDIMIRLFIVIIPFLFVCTFLGAYQDNKRYAKYKSTIYNQKLKELNRYKDYTKQQENKQRNERELERKRSKARMDSMVKNGFRNVTSTDRNLDLDTDLFNK